MPSSFSKAPRILMMSFMVSDRKKSCTKVPLNQFFRMMWRASARRRCIFSTTLCLCQGLALHLSVLKFRLRPEHTGGIVLIRLLYLVFLIYLRVEDVRAQSHREIFLFLSQKLVLASVFSDVLAIYFFFSVARIYVVPIVPDLGPSLLSYARLIMQQTNAVTEFYTSNVALAKSAAV